jgi:hypothetical protein
MMSLKATERALEAIRINQLKIGLLYLNVGLI